MFKVPFFVYPHKGGQNQEKPPSSSPLPGTHVSMLGPKYFPKGPKKGTIPRFWSTADCGRRRVRYQPCGLRQRREGRMLGSSVGTAGLGEERHSSKAETPSLLLRSGRWRTRSPSRLHRRFLHQYASNLQIPHSASHLVHSCRMQKNSRNMAWNQHRHRDRWATGGGGEEGGEERGGGGDAACGGNSF